MPRIKPLALALLLLPCAAALSGCTVRETTTPRSATEVLLLSTAAERAVARYDLTPLAGLRVAIDAARYEGVDKSFVVSALRSQVVRGGARLVKDLRLTKPKAPAPEAIIELRNGTFGIWDGAFTLGVPPLTWGTVGDSGTFPPFFLLSRGSQQAYCKLQLTAYDPLTQAPIQRVHDLWGHAYYNTWWVLGFGPFLRDQDIYPTEAE